MPRRRGVQGPPAEHLAAGLWPDGTPRTDAPLAVAYAQEIATRLQEALEDRTISDVASQASLARSTIHDLLTGRTWPDIVTLAKLEYELGTRLWPDRPPKMAKCK